jgi:hypothetical protein
MMSKNEWEQRGHKWRQNIAHARCMLDKQMYARPRTYTRLGTRTLTNLSPTNTHPLAHTHTQYLQLSTQQYLRYKYNVNIVNCFIQ